MLFRSVLTIADSRGFAERGCVMWFELENNRVRFGVNQTAAGDARLRISSQLLKLALLIPD